MPRKFMPVKSKQRQKLDTLANKPTRDTFMQKYVEQKMAWIQATVYEKFLSKNEILQGQNEHSPKIPLLCPDQIIMNLTQILASLGPKIWNSVNIKSTETFEEFKNFIKTWDDEICKCRVRTIKSLEKI